MNKRTLTVVLIIISMCSSILVNLTSLSQAQTGLVVFITSDTTWTRANSPYTLTGPTVVSTGVTLTIESGVTVNLNDYALLINGTLKAIGSISENIHITGFNFTFSESASPSSRLENVIIDAPISSSKPLTLNNNTINKHLILSDSSTISKNIIAEGVESGDSTTFSDNTITGEVNVGDFCVFSGNEIHGDVHTRNSAVISNNYINGSHVVIAPFGGHSYTIALTVGSLSVVSNNAISGGVTATSSNITGNTIDGGADFTDWAGRPEDATSALTVKGDSYVTSNVIYSTTGGYGLMIDGGSSLVSGNLVKNMIRVAGNAVIDGNYVTSGGIQVGHIFISAFNDIDYGYGDSIIKNNVINGSLYGVYSTGPGGTATIQNNLIQNCEYGISLMSQATIQNNTIFNSSTAIGLVSGGAIDTSQPINYNNIITYSENSVLLANFPLNVDATYNWWGTTDTQAINLTIHDFKYDLNLGTVTFLPILNAQNPEAPSTSYTIQIPNTPALPTSTPTPTPTITPTPNPTLTPTQTPQQTTSPTPTPSIEPTATGGLPPEAFYALALAVIGVTAIIALTIVILKRQKK